MRIIISSKNKLLNTILDEVGNNIAIISVSTNNSFIDVVDKRVKIHLKLWFDDVDKDEHGKTISDDDVVKIIDVLNKIKLYDIDTLICQCDAGISRSAAIAAASSVILIGPYANNWIFNDKRYCPNMMVYRKILNTFFGSSFNE